MHRSLVALWVALAAAIVAIAALAQFWIAQRERSTATRVQELLTAQLAPVNQAIKRVVDEYSLELERSIASTNLSDPAACAELKRSPLIRVLVVVDGQQQMMFYPRELRSATIEDRALVDEAQQVLRDYFPRTPQPPSRTVAQQAQTASQSSALDNALAFPNSKWITWYHRRGLMIGYVWQQESRWQAVAVLPRARWMADIVSTLADFGSADLKPQSLRQLVDVEGKVVHQWSSLPQSEWTQMSQMEPDAEVAVNAPLEGWRLREFASEAYRRSLAGDDLRLPIWLAVCGLSVSLALTGLLVTLNVNRQIRLAQQRVSFVNQVSHELRTPLTNICMYADLIAQSLERDDEITAEETQQQDRLSVIRAESKRLTRLVNNVLEFARPVATKKLQRSPEELDVIVAETLATFEPKLCELGFVVERNLNCRGMRSIDRGAVEQILVNLIGNAEKYASSGRYLRIETHDVGDQVEVIVADRGPGIPVRLREQIFKPFVRMTDRLEDPTGTGIGLTIARELAQRHGGNCELMAAGDGAAFRCSLNAPPVG